MPRKKHTKKHHVEPKITYNPPGPDSIPETVRKVGAFIVHEHIHPNSGAYADAPSGWGKITENQIKFMQKAGEHQVNLEGVKVVYDKGKCKVYGTQVWKENGQLHTLPFVSGPLGKGALPGLLCGTGNRDPLAINGCAKIEPYSITKVYNKNIKGDWKCKVAGLSDPNPGNLNKREKRDEFLMHVENITANSHGCPTYPKAFARTAERFIDEHAGKSKLYINPCEQGMRIAKELDKERMRMAGEEYKQQIGTKKPEVSLAQVSSLPPMNNGRLFRGGR